MLPQLTALFAIQQTAKSNGRFCTSLYKKASIRWQDSAPPISGYWPTSELNAG